MASRDGVADCAQTQLPKCGSSSQGKNVIPASSQWFMCPGYGTSHRSNTFRSLLSGWQRHLQLRAALALTGHFDLDNGGAAADATDEYLMHAGLQAAQQSRFGEIHVVLANCGATARAIGVYFEQQFAAVLLERPRPLARHTEARSNINNTNTCEVRRRSEFCREHQAVACQQVRATPLLVRKLERPV